MIELQIQLYVLVVIAIILLGAGFFIGAIYAYKSADKIAKKALLKTEKHIEELKLKKKKELARPNTDIDWNELCDRASG